MNIKVFFWSPHLSNVATINNVINSAYSLVKFGKNLYIPTILDSIGEWDVFRHQIEKQKINYYKITSVNFSRFFPIKGFFFSRFLSLIIYLTNFIPLRRALLDQSPKYLIIHLITSLPLSLLFFFKFNTNFILRISGLPKLNIFRRYLWTLLGKKIFLVTCPSEETRNYLLKLNIFPKNKIVVLLDPILNLSEIIKKKNDTDNSQCNKNYFLSIGRLTKQKNHILLIKFFKIFLQKYNNYYLYIIGDGDLRFQLEQEIKKLQLEEKIILLGYQKNIFPYLAKAKAFVSPSLWEDPGATMIESAFCNTTIISSDCVSGPKEFIENNKAGYLFQNNNLQSLLDTFQYYLNDSEKNILKKKLIAKKKISQYTIFAHYKKLNKLLI